MRRPEYSSSPKVELRMQERAYARHVQKLNKIHASIDQDVDRTTHFDFSRNERLKQKVQAIETANLLYSFIGDDSFDASSYINSKRNIRDSRSVHGSKPISSSIGFKARKEWINNQSKYSTFDSDAGDVKGDSSIVFLTQKGHLRKNRNISTENNGRGKSVSDMVTMSPNLNVGTQMNIRQFQGRNISGSAMAKTSGTSNKLYTDEIIQVGFSESGEDFNAKLFGDGGVKGASKLPQIKNKREAKKTQTPIQMKVTAGKLSKCCCMNGINTGDYENIGDEEESQCEDDVLRSSVRTFPRQGVDYLHKNLTGHNATRGLNSSNLSRSGNHDKKFNRDCKTNPVMGKRQGSVGRSSLNMEQQYQDESNESKELDVTSKTVPLKKRSNSNNSNGTLFGNMSKKFDGGRIYLKDVSGVPSKGQIINVKPTSANKGIWQMKSGGSEKNLRDVIQNGERLSVKASRGASQRDLASYSGLRKSEISPTKRMISPKIDSRVQVKPNSSNGKGVATSQSKVLDAIHDQGVKLSSNMSSSASVGDNSRSGGIQNPSTHKSSVLKSEDNDKSNKNERPLRRLSNNNIANIISSNKSSSVMSNKSGRSSINSTASLRDIEIPCKDGSTKDNSKKNCFSTEHETEKGSKKKDDSIDTSKPNETDQGKDGYNFDISKTDGSIENNKDITVNSSKPEERVTDKKNDSIDVSKLNEGIIDKKDNDVDSTKSNECVIDHKDNDADSTKSNEGIINQESDKEGVTSNSSKYNNNITDQESEKGSDKEGVTSNSSKHNNNITDQESEKGSDKESFSSNNHRQNDIVTDKSNTNRDFDSNVHEHDDIGQEGTMDVKVKDESSKISENVLDIGRNSGRTNDKDDKTDRNLLCSKSENAENASINPGDATIHYTNLCENDEKKYASDTKMQSDIDGREVRSGESLSVKHENFESEPNEKIEQRKKEKSGEANRRNTDSVLCRNPMSGNKLSKSISSAKNFPKPSFDLGGKGHSVNNTNSKIKSRKSSASDGINSLPNTESLPDSENAKHDKCRSSAKQDNTMKQMKQQQERRSSLNIKKKNARRSGASDASVPNDANNETASEVHCEMNCSTENESERISSIPHVSDAVCSRFNPSDESKRARRRRRLTKTVEGSRSEYEYEYYYLDDKDNERSKGQDIVVPEKEGNSKTSESNTGEFNDKSTMKINEFNSSRTSDPSLVENDKKNISNLNTNGGNHNTQTNQSEVTDGKHLENVTNSTIPTEEQLVKHDEQVTTDEKKELDTDVISQNTTEASTSWQIEDPVVPGKIEETEHKTGELLDDNSVSLENLNGRENVSDKDDPQPSNKDIEVLPIPSISGPADSIISPSRPLTDSKAEDNENAKTTPSTAKETAECIGSDVGDIEDPKLHQKQLEDTDFPNRMHEEAPTDSNKDHVAENPSSSGNRSINSSRRHSNESITSTKKDKEGDPADFSEQSDILPSGSPISYDKKLCTPTGSLNRLNGTEEEAFATPRFKQDNTNEKHESRESKDSSNSARDLKEPRLNSPSTGSPHEGITDETSKNRKMSDFGDSTNDKVDEQNRNDTKEIHSDVTKDESLPDNTGRASEDGDKSVKKITEDESKTMEPSKDSKNDKDSKNSSLSKGSETSKLSRKHSKSKDSVNEKGTSVLSTDNEYDNKASKNESEQVAEETTPGDKSPIANEQISHTQDVMSSGCSENVLSPKGDDTEKTLPNQDEEKRVDNDNYEGLGDNESKNVQNKCSDNELTQNTNHSLDEKQCMSSSNSHALVEKDDDVQKEARNDNDNELSIANNSQGNVANSEKQSDTVDNSDATNPKDGTGRSDLVSNSSETSSISSNVKASAKSDGTGSRGVGPFSKLVESLRETNTQNDIDKKKLKANRKSAADSDAENKTRPSSGVKTESKEKHANKDHDKTLTSASSATNAKAKESSALNSSRRKSSSSSNKAPVKESVSERDSNLATNIQEKKVDDTRSATESKANTVSIPDNNEDSKQRVNRDIEGENHNSEDSKQKQEDQAESIGNSDGKADPVVDSDVKSLKNNQGSNSAGTESGSNSITEKLHDNQSETVASSSLKLGQKGTSVQKDSMSDSNDIKQTSKKDVTEANTGTGEEPVSNENRSYVPIESPRTLNDDDQTTVLNDSEDLLTLKDLEKTPDPDGSRKSSETKQEDGPDPVLTEHKKPSDSPKESLDTQEHTELHDTSLDKESNNGVDHAEDNPNPSSSSNKDERSRQAPSGEGSATKSINNAANVDPIHRAEELIGKANDLLSDMNSKETKAEEIQAAVNEKREKVEELKAKVKQVRKESRKSSSSSSVKNESSGTSDDKKKSSLKPSLTRSPSRPMNTIIPTSDEPGVSIVVGPSDRTDTENSHPDSPEQDNVFADLNANKQANTDSKHEQQTHPPESANGHSQKSDVLNSTQGGEVSQSKEGAEVFSLESNEQESTVIGRVNSSRETSENVNGHKNEKDVNNSKDEASHEKRNDKIEADVERKSKHQDTVDNKPKADIREDNTSHKSKRSSGSDTNGDINASKSRNKSGRSDGSDVNTKVKHSRRTENVELVDEVSIKKEHHRYKSKDIVEVDESFSEVRQHSFKRGKLTENDEVNGPEDVDITSTDANSVNRRSSHSNSKFSTPDNKRKDDIEQDDVNRAARKSNTINRNALYEEVSLSSDIYAPGYNGPTEPENILSHSNSRKGIASKQLASSSIDAYRQSFSRLHGKASLKDQISYIKGSNSEIQEHKITHLYVPDSDVAEEASSGNQRESLVQTREQMRSKFLKSKNIEKSGRVDLSPAGLAQQRMSSMLSFVESNGENEESSVSFSGLAMSGVGRSLKHHTSGRQASRGALIPSSGSHASRATDNSISPDKGQQKTRWL